MSTTNILTGRWVGTNSKGPSWRGKILPIRLPNGNEQQALNELTVRLLRPEEVSRAKALSGGLHYLKNADLAGDQLCYLAEHGGHWRALIWSSAPALHLKRREQWIGWTHAQKCQRRRFLAQKSRFLILADRRRLPNLATRVLALSCQRLSQDTWGPAPAARH